MHKMKIVLTPTQVSDILGDYVLSKYKLQDTETKVFISKSKDGYITSFEINLDEAKPKKDLKDVNMEG